MTRAIDELLEVMARLRDPEGGCPWDLEQDFASIAPYTIEEVYEVVEAIEAGDRAALKDELGDLLFQVVFHSRLAEEEGSFAFDDVARAITGKMIRRHPHVFGDASVAGAAAQTAAWEAQKAEERAARASGGALDGVTATLPAQTRALKLQARAARVGFDWKRPAEVIAKIEEEIGELQAELAAGADPGRVEDELGDLMFACVNLARKLAVDPEGALRRANRKFERRFRAIERALAAEGRSPAQSDLAEMEALWQRAKASEAAS